MKKTDYLSTLFVGIDIGSRTNVVSAIDFNQDFFIRMKPVPNAKEGAETLSIMSSPKSFNFRLFFKYLPHKTEQKMYDSHCILY